MTTIDAHTFGGFRDTAVKFGKLMLDEFALVRVGRVLERWKAKRHGRYSILDAERWQIFRGNIFLAGHDDHALDRVPQLADISRPGILSQRFHRIVRKLLRLAFIAR